jgi:hypothetical protein
MNLTRPVSTLRLLSSLLLPGALLFSLPRAEAQIFYSTGHGDIGVGYENGEFNPHWHLGGEDEGEEHSPGDVIALVQKTASSPTGLSAAIGVADGSPIWLAGSSAYQPNLGFATEELDPTDWIGDITVTLTAWTTPDGGAFSLFTANTSLTEVTDIFFSTVSANATLASNTFTITPGDHQHFRFGFTTEGDYTLTLQWSGLHVTDGIKTGEATFGATVVPEPSTFAFVGFGLVAIAWRAVRRKTAKHA